MTRISASAIANSRMSARDGLRYRGAPLRRVPLVTSGNMRNTSTCGGIGSAVAASWMLGLGRKETQWAMAHALSTSGGLWECRNEPGATKHLHVAEAARRGDPRAGQAAPIVSVQKMAASQNLHRLGRAALDLQGPYGMLGGPDALADDRAFETVATAFMISIGGGTDQIQRNIVGERVLGLPGEPRTDKDVSFRDLPADGSAR